MSSLVHADQPPRERVQPTPLEIACGWVFDIAESSPLLPAASPDPFEALKQAVLPAVRRPPCVVSFSGGVDSSLVLAAAVEAAQREGLDAPVPVTLRFANAGPAREDAWQERGIRHLGLSDWVRLSFDDELDLVGPVATRGLLRHGVMWPSNAHFQVPVFEQAAGGAALTGYGGDHVLSGWPSRRVADVLCGRVRPTPRDVLRVAAIATPRPLRYWRERRRAPERDWLSAAASQDSARVQARIAAKTPRRWSRWLHWQIGTRRVRLAQSSLALLGADAQVTVYHPLLDPVFVGALARIGESLGIGDRKTIVKRIASQHIPGETAARRTKASFDEVFFNRHTRGFAERWDGGGVDTQLVQLEQLRHRWLSPSPNAGTGLLLQTAWLTNRI